MEEKGNKERKGAEAVFWNCFSGLEVGDGHEASGGPSLCHSSWPRVPLKASSLHCAHGHWRSSRVIWKSCSVDSLS